MRTDKRYVNEDKIKMPYKKFFEGGSEHENLEALSRLLTNPTVKILWKHAETLLLKKDKGVYGKTIFYVFYQDRKEELKQQLDDFYRKLEIAKEVSMDERYFSLKNQKQREIFLLAVYSLTKDEAQDVIELLKPEMAEVIRSIEEEEKVAVEGY